MPMTAEMIAAAGKSSMDFIMRGKPNDIYNIDRPLLQLLRKNQKSFPGAKQYIVEKLRTTNDSNFQWFGPDEEVSYNRKRTLSEASFAWGSAHDGFALTEEELLANYISVTDDRNATPTTSEEHQFVNLITENTETLKLGFAEMFDWNLHLNGTQDADAIPGLDHLVSTTPSTGTVGGIDRATTPAWRNFASMNVASTTGLLTSELEKMWRNTARVGGSSPDIILAGSKFIDAYRADAKASMEVNVTATNKGYGLDAGNNSLSFRGIPIVWDPVLDDLQAAGVSAGGYDWDKRAYLLNSRYIRLRPAEGQDMVTRRPPRVYNRYTHYWGLTWRGAVTITRPAAHAVMSVA
jgi:hypothetical protein